VRGGFGPALLTSRNERGHLEPLRQGYDDKDDDQDAANDQCDPRHIKKVNFARRSHKPRHRPRQAQKLTTGRLHRPYTVHLAITARHQLVRHLGLTACRFFD
jgi:hypothetical protein